MTTLTFLFIVLAGVVSSSLAQDTCASLNCGPNKYCFDGNTKLCLACHRACSGCSGPGSDECITCAVGYYLLNNDCIECPDDQWGAGCNGTCHCLDNALCDTVTGHCVGKCAKGYAPPPACQEECQEGFYGLDCVEECHCVNDSVCHKQTGFCPLNLCHPDWFGSACRKRLPQLSTTPTVTEATCEYFTVQWRGWDSNQDFGDPELPVAQYRLYSRIVSGNSNGSVGGGGGGWTLRRTIPQDISVRQWVVNVTGLEPNVPHVFRVDLHASDDGKVLDTASLGLPTDLPAFAPCATTTVPPPITVPIIVGADIFTALSATPLPSGQLLVTWSIDPQFLRFSWNLTLSYTLLGIGNCAGVTDGEVTSVSVDQSDTEFRIQGLAPWRRFYVELTAQGLGSVSAANDTQDVTGHHFSPNGTISQVRVSNRQARQVTLSWTDVPCAQRGGVLLRYDVTVRPKSGLGITKVMTTNVTSLVVGGLEPYTEYLGSVRYVNRVGSGPPSPEFIFTTAQGVPAAVSIVTLTPTASTVEVKVEPPDPVHGVLEAYSIMYSDTATFTPSESLTFNVSSPGFPVVSRLAPYTIYYFKARGRTAAGYGPYGNVTYVRTLQARPHAPVSLLQTSGNLTCVIVTWLTPDQSAITISGYTLTLINVRTGKGLTVTLEANATSYTHCDLDPGSAYNLSLTSRSGAGSGQPTSLMVTTEQPDPPAPPSPTLVDVAPTYASVEIEPVTLTPGVEVAYQLQVERLVDGSGSARRKRLAELPGYVTAQFSGPEVRERLMFVVGDGRQYGGHLNQPLLPGNTYRLYYIVLSVFYNLTKFNYTRMDAPILTPLPPTTTPDPTTLPGTEAVTTSGPSPEDDNGVLIGVIVALLLLIVLIVAAIILILWWRRRQRMRLMRPPPYLELDEGHKGDVKGAEEEGGGRGGGGSDMEKYWSLITELSEPRHIVVGRECVPDSQLVPVSRPAPPPGAAKVTFRKEFRSLPKQARPRPGGRPPPPPSSSSTSTRKAESYPDLNRFHNLLPYDHTLVKLKPDRSGRCDYINASFLSGYRRPKAYVAAQSPYDDRTAVDFWRLIYQRRIKTVLLVSSGVEGDVVRCTQYWPREGKATMGQFHLELEEEKVYADLAVRLVTVRESGEPHAQVVRLFDYTSWPQHGVPADPIPFLDLRYKVRQYHGDEAGPILVHCGTGVGRTGVFIAVDSLIDQYASEGRVSVYSFVRKMRKERPLMVRTLKQYQFIYECLLEEFQAGDTMTDPTLLRDTYRHLTSRNVKTGRSFLRDQFQLLHRLTEGPTPAECRAASHPDNAKRNRYPDVLPSDLYRPQLITPAKLANTDYINAVFVDGYRQQNQFIVTQTPLHTTLTDFWRLLYDHRACTVLMLDRFRHEADTCAQYWPRDVNMKQWEPFFVESTADFQQGNVTIRNLKVVNSLRPKDAPHLVRQFHLDAWPRDALVPPSKTMMLDLIDTVLTYHASSPHPDSPIVVHCEDGATHSGLWVCLALLCERLEEEQEVDVYHVIKHVKRRRPQIIPDYEQLRFLYRALWDYINQRMAGGTFTADTPISPRSPQGGGGLRDTLYGVQSLSLTSHLGDSSSLY
ncbi:LOW QUALITY PROTEIN: receptor-type tyrosine-protein phosphatase T-like [Babylonia areolata]|uniref:LOW QUALITY PROTEIN: receptor-type tyrosine-protein phosphatase T-like n=1 Tax=Babylonia areolata TaxID=304850 RepID=UPI003FCFD403